MQENLIEEKPLQKKQNPIIRIIKLIIWIGIIYFIMFYNSYSTFKNKELIKEDKILKIKKGETFYSLSSKLNLDKKYLKIYLGLNKPDFLLQAGNYKIKKLSNIKKIINSFKKPIIEDEKIILFEGWNIFDYDNLLSKKGLIKAGDFIKKSQNISPSLIAKFPFLNGAKTLEGFLYPDTYNINIATFKIDNFIETMLYNFDKKVNKKILQNLSSQKINTIINLASILEKEEKNNENKKIVAGILQKRLDENWFIGADATVCYPYKLIYTDCTPSFIGNHIKDKNDYNLRNKLGLPKTPISNPTYSTIEATINYKKTSYYYYLHGNDGKIHYAKTNTEHTKNKNTYLK